MTWDGPLSSNEGMTLNRPPRPPELMLITGSGFPPAARTTQGKVLLSQIGGRNDARLLVRLARRQVSPLSRRDVKELFAEHHAEFAFYAFFQSSMGRVDFVGGECPVRRAICQ